MMESTKATAGVRKAKKKQAKEEIDRIKQAEKKKRRLEKALANSAAIRSELEKKKQKKKEEQERLDEEGAAIAEAVALNVLLGEDSDDSSKIMLKKDEGLASWDHASNMDIMKGDRQSLLPYQDLPKYSDGNIGRVSNAHGFGHMWNHRGTANLKVSSEPFGRDYPQFFGEEEWGPMDLSAGHLAAQAVSSLKIADNAQVDACVFNRMLRG